VTNRPVRTDDDDWHYWQENECKPEFHSLVTATTHSNGSLENSNEDLRLLLRREGLEDKLKYKLRTSELKAKLFYGKNDSLITKVTIGTIKKVENTR
jgi:hypothetical protein